MSRGRGRGGLLERFGVGAVSIGAAAGAIGATYKVTEFIVKCKRLFDVRSENAVFVRLVERVQIDLAETDRLLALKEVKEALRNNKGKTLWIKSKVDNMHEAIAGMTKYTSKVAKAGWWLGIKTRIWWILDEYEKLCHRELELAMAREGILSVIEFLTAFELAPKPKSQGREKEEGRERGERDERREQYAGEERKSSRRVIELDFEGRPKREQRVERVEREFEERPRREQRVEREYDYEVEEDYEVKKPRRRNYGQEGFYDGQLNGPLSTRPRFWQQLSGQQDNAPKREVFREEEEVVDSKMGPLRVHWPTAKL